MGSQTLVPQAGAAQREAALERANEIRIARAGLKRKVRADGPLYGPLRVAHLLCEADRPEWFEGMRIADLVAACSRMGRYRVARLFETVGVPELKTVGEATFHQRHAVAAALEDSVWDQLSRRERQDFERQLTAEHDRGQGAA